MHRRKFFSFTYVLMLVFFVVFVCSGCGGGSSTRNLNQPESHDVTPIPDPDPTPTPDPDPVPIPDPDPDPTPIPTPTRYTVTFDSDGGSEVASITVNSGSTIEMPDPPTKEGYIFIAWYKDRNFNEEFTFGTNGDKITSNITLYARWLDYDLTVAENAAINIVIGYAEGDNPRYVTRNLTLQTKIDSADVSWISNSRAISPNGTVTRQAQDTEVTLTATAAYNGKSSEPRTFNLRVIRERTRDNSSIEALTIEESAIGDIEIARNESGNITDIEGQYVSFDIQNADDALDAATVLRDELGISSPDNELELFLAESDSYGSDYALQQVYNGVKVFGRRIIVSASSEGKASFLHSDFLASNVLESADMKLNLTAQQAEQTASEGYTGDVSTDSENTELVIFSAGKYEDAPIYAYIMRVYGYDADGDYFDDTVFVNAETGSVIMNSTNLHTNSNSEEGEGRDELGNDVNFPVVQKKESIFAKDYMYYMQDPDAKIEVYTGNDKNPLKSSTKTFNDSQAVTAYTNMREILQWWKASFDRKGINGKGGTVKVIAHETVANDTDNAFWNSGYKAIFVCNLGDKVLYEHSKAVGIDTLTHESTHGVIYYAVGDLPYENARGAVDEGYADIFGCLKDGDWRHGWRSAHDPKSPDIGITFLRDKTKCIRDIREDVTVSSLSEGTLNTIDDLYNMYATVKPVQDYKSPNYNDGNRVHKYSRLISHAAYLMHQDGNPTDGLTWRELGDVWYKSIRKGISLFGISIQTGISSSSNAKDFDDVRRCVLTAAKEMKLPSNKIAAIEKAFNDVGITDLSANFSGKVTDANTGTPLSGVRVALYTNITPRDSRSGNKKALLKSETLLTEYFSMKLNEGTYTVTFSKAGYETYTTEVSIGNEGVELNVGLSGAVIVSGDVPIDEAHFPDDVFREYVRGFDTNGDNLLSEAERSVVTEIDLSYLYITSLKGIEYFTSLQTLECSLRQLTDLDLTGLTALQRLYCDYNQLKSLNLTGCTALQELWCSGNQLTSLDLTGLTALHRLYCKNNQLTNLYLTDCTALEWLECDDNQLTSLNLTGCADLQYLDCRNNQLTSLNLTGCTALQHLECDYNQLTNLDLSGCTTLQSLTCRNNQLTSLNLTDCTALIYLLCDENVNVIRSNSTTQAITTTTTKHTSVTSEQSFIVAEIPEFYANHSGTYTFSISFDHELPSGTSLTLEGSSGSFSFTDQNGNPLDFPTSSSLTHANVSAYFDEGKTYAPVIAARSETQSNSGGCNLNVYASISILLAGLFLSKKRP